MTTEPQVFEDEDATTYVLPPDESRLAQLHAEYADAKAAADETASRLKAITDGIKAELTNAAPDEQRVELRGEAGPTLRLTCTRRATFDSKRFKSEHPLTYVEYAKFSDSWSLRQVGSGDQ